MKKQILFTLFLGASADKMVPGLNAPYNTFFFVQKPAHNLVRNLCEQADGTAVFRDDSFACTQNKTVLVWPKNICMPCAPDHYPSMSQVCLDQGGLSAYISSAPGLGFKGFTAGHCRPEDLTGMLGASYVICYKTSTPPQPGECVPLVPGLGNDQAAPPVDYIRTCKVDGKKANWTNCGAQDDTGHPMYRCGEASPSPVTPASDSDTSSWVVVPSAAVLILGAAKKYGPSLHWQGLFGRSASQQKETELVVCGGRYGALGDVPNPLSEKAAATMTV
jgi:hypothetical protein